MIKSDINNTCCFTGHRPGKCLGTEAYLRELLGLKITEAINEGYTVFL